MLFPLDPQTPQCAVFELLNNELLHFLRNCINTDNFSDELFSKYQIENNEVLSVCWSNNPTRDKFLNLWNNLPKKKDDRQILFDTVNDAQNIATFFDDTHATLPELKPEPLFDAFKKLTTHLFENTKDLAQAKYQSRSSIEKHYQAFVQANGNGHLCFICGSIKLSQNRNDIIDEDQWRGDYDHLLCKDKYPVYSVHPGNFIPTCHICNSKAKGARNLLKHPDGRRRTAFYSLPPSQESCYPYAKVDTHLRNRDQLLTEGWDMPLSKATISFPRAPNNIAEKIQVWEEVYQVQSRVENNITTSFGQRVAQDLLNPENFEEFREQLSRQVRRPPVDYKTSECRFWWHKVYLHLAKQNDDFLRDVWSIIEWYIRQTPDDDMLNTYGY